ncbi:MAG: phosphoribosylanthranilate isomerase [Deltaproteobacteria bacterium]|nr:phosphoribosylanthranilate isomerase [Deltaproteobacteria bacterium]
MAVGVKVKICGITSVEDALMAVEAGADALGFVFWKNSPRYVDPAKAGEIVKALPPFVITVGVFVDEKQDVVNNVVKEAGLTVAQLHGSETNDYIKGVHVKSIKAVRVKSTEDMILLASFDAASAVLLDTYKEGVPGGTGTTFDWEIASGTEDFATVILSGGLTPDNVARAVKMVRPYAVDVSSGVESKPGKKDAKKVQKFIKEAKSA